MDVGTTCIEIEFCNNACQEVKGRNGLGCALIPSHRTATVTERHAERGETIEIATVIGHHSAVGLAA